MGWNTVAFLLNDHSHELEESPKTVAWALAHPPVMCDPEYITHQVRLVAQTNKERMISQQTIHILPSFHADNRIFFMAGGNTIVDCEVLKYGKTKEGKKTVTLVLPEWA